MRPTSRARCSRTGPAARRSRMTRRATTSTSACANSRCARSRTASRLHGGYIPYVGTFLTFSDYARNALRMAALMKLRTIFVFTHDSIGLGEDGPTHQSVEHAASLRLIPHMDVWRPCDTVETAVAWAAAIERARRPVVPAAHAAERAVPAARRRRRSPRSAAAATCWRTGRRGQPARGDHRDRLGGRPRDGRAHGARGRGASRFASCRCPARSIFDRQDASYRASVLPAGVPRVAVEAGSTSGWHKYVGAIDDGRGAIVGLDTFGESAPAGVLFKHLRLHRGARRRRGEARRPHECTATCRPPRHARRCAGASHACASTAGARPIAA